MMADPSQAARPRSPLPAGAGIRPGADTDVRLPGGWLVAVWLQADGRTVAGETLAGLVVSTRLPNISIDWGWRGATQDANGARLWWALATAHFPASDSPPTVTFMHRLPRERRTAHPATPPGLWKAADGLWAAATTGRYTTIRCLTGSAATARRLTPATTRREP